MLNEQCFHFSRPAGAVLEACAGSLALGLCIDRVLARLRVRQTGDSLPAQVHAQCMCREPMHRPGKQLWLPPKAAHVADNAAMPAPAGAQPAEGCASA